MLVIFTVGGKQHSYFIPIFRVPIHIPKGPQPGNYDTLITDATLLATIADLTSRVSDPRAGESLQQGIESALKAMQAHAGEGVEIHLTAPQG